MDTRFRVPGTDQIQALAEFAPQVGEVFVQVRPHNALVERGRFHGSVEARSLHRLEADEHAAPIGVLEGRRIGLARPRRT